MEEKGKNMNLPDLLASNSLDTNLLKPFSYISIVVGTGKYKDIHSDFCRCSLPHISTVTPRHVLRNVFI